MRFKLKMSRKQLTVVAIVVLLLIGVLVARHHSGPGADRPMDTAATRACTDFASGYPHARDKAARLTLADKVTHFSSQSDNRTIADRAAEMGRSAGDTDARWKSSAHALTDACQAAGRKA